MVYGISLNRIADQTDEVPNDVHPLDSNLAKYNVDGAWENEQDRHSHCIDEGYTNVVDASPNGRKVKYTSGASSVSSDSLDSSSKLNAAASTKGVKEGDNVRRQDK